MGAEDYLPKPFEPVLLRARIGACLEKKRLRDQEVEYLRQVKRVTAAAGAVEAGTFAPEALIEVAERSDELGQLARVFQHMAREVYAREQRLKQQVEELRIEIDQAKKVRQGEEITGSEYFQELRQKARRLRYRPGSGEC
jgi:DNA-binding response OmpR family regulator